MEEFNQRKYFKRMKQLSQVLYLLQFETRLPVENIGQAYKELKEWIHRRKCVRLQCFPPLSKYGHITMLGWSRYSTKIMNYFRKNHTFRINRNLSAKYPILPQNFEPCSEYVKSCYKV